MFTTNPKTHEFILNYESDPNLPDDEIVFDELTNIITANIHDHTDAGTAYDQVQLLNGATNGVIGSVLTIPVGAGDKVSAEVYAKYLAPTGTNNPAAAIGNLVLGAITGNIGGTNYEGAINNGYGTNGTVTNLINANASSTEPMAFINLLFLPDDAANTIESSHFAFKQVTPASSNSHAILALDEPYEAPEAGYVVVYLSNESAQLTEVYFDDLEVTVEEHPVIQTADYYPGGAIFNSYNRVTAKKNSYHYQNKEWQTNSDLNLYDFEWRQYDPYLWRTPVHDPNAEDYNQLSPYSWVANNPISNVDPDGMDWYRYSDDDGNESVIWREGNDQTIDVDGQTYNNIGAAFATQAADGSLVIYNQNEVFAIVDSEAPAGDPQEQALLSQLQNPEAEVNYNTMTPLYGTMFFAAETALMISGEAGLSGQTSRTPRNGLKRTNQSPRGQNAVLNEAQKANLKRFLKKAPANSKPPQLRVLGNGNVQISIESPGRVPGSRAVYVKEIDSTGSTVKMYKITRDPQFNLVHNKNKMPGN